MNGTNKVELKLGDKTLSLRYTYERLRDVSRITGNGLLTIVAKAATFDFDAITTLVWAASAHPENGMKDWTPEQFGKLIGEHLGASRRILKALRACQEESFKDEESEDDAPPTDGPKA